MRQTFLLALLAGCLSLTAKIAESGQALLVTEVAHLDRTRECLGGRINLYAVLGDNCIVSISSDHLKSLSSCRIPYSVIARDIDPSTCYLAVTSPDGGPNINSISNCLYVSGDVAVIQAGESEAEALRGMGFRLIGLKPIAPAHQSIIRKDGLMLGHRSGDGFIEKMVSEVSADSLEANVRALAGFLTRYSFTDSCQSAGQWIYDKFQSYGVDAEFHYYDWNSNHWRNVVGTIPGKTDSTVIVIACGHFDATSEDPWDLAPGAEDNGSGTAALIEAARVLSTYDHDYTLRLICFSGEEQGLVGSYAYVSEAYLRGDGIAAAMNFDMVGYTDDSHYDMSVLFDSSSFWLANLVMAASRFSGAELYSSRYTSPSSDHWYFQQYGYPATTSFHVGRTHGYPFYHSIYDTAGNENPRFLAEVTKTVAASMAMLADGYPQPPLAPRFVVARDAGTGGALEVEWSASESPFVLGYNVYWGRSPRQYQHSIYAGDTDTVRLTGLVNDTTYYVTVTSIDNSSEGGYSPEAVGIPRQVPLPPAGLTLTPIYLGMDMVWKPNLELDMAGYNIYRSTISGGPYQLANPAPVPDTVYTDSGLPPGEMQYYVLTAVDSSGLESGYSDERSSYPMSFDHGILLVDETKHGTGGVLVPDSIQDRFYEQILSGYRFEPWSCDSQGLPAISTMGLYSTIIWRGEDFYEQHLAEEAESLGYYLSHGGRLWIIGWKGIRALMTYGDYPFTFVPGDWPFDYIHLASSDNTKTVGLTSARGEAGYPSVSVDSTKVPSSWHGSLYMIDTAVPNDAEIIYTFVSDGTDTTFDGEPVATRYICPSFRLVFFGFPLYYMKQAEAKAVADAVLNGLGEEKGVTEYVWPHGRRLASFRNYPNPFSHSTRISAMMSKESPYSGNPSVRIYDAAGRLVKLLPLGRSGDGAFETTWEAVADDGRPMSSGIYFCRLSDLPSSKTLKLVLIR